MKFLALVSGGKDSHYNILHCLKNGHELVVMANIRPLDLQEQELDSFMFQTCGHDLIDKYPLVSSVPIEFGSIEAATSIITTLTYDNDGKSEDDEIEKLFDLLKKCVEKYDFEAVSVGAILSSYQRNRVEACCSRLGLKVLSYLWQRNQEDLMNEMCLVSKMDFDDESEINKLDARIIKTAAIGLNASDLGKSLPQIKPKMEKLNRLYDVHICGEGGEFETLVLDSPIFDKGYFKLKKINIENNNDNRDDVYSCTFDVEIVPKPENSNSALNNQKYINSVVSPPHLEHKWEFINSELAASSPNLQLSIDAIDVNDTVSLPLTVCKLGNLLHIQNIQPMKTDVSLTRQCDEVFKQLFDVLHANNLSKKQILSTTLSLKDIKNFSLINQNYVRFFSKIGSLPPSRACLGNKLIPGELQLSCIVTLDDRVTPFKDGIHVQGISYWNPCNIGPYSQIIFPKAQPNKIGYMAGQIPLIPESMVLNKSDKTGKQKWIENSVLTLRHYDHLKNLVGLKHNLITVCYISSQEILEDSDLGYAVSSAVSVWGEYSTLQISSENTDGSASEREARFAYESDEFTCKQNISNFVVVLVDELPASAPLEIGGIVCSALDARDDEQLSDTESEPSFNFPSETGVNVLNNSISYNYSMMFFQTMNEFKSFVNENEINPFQGTVYFNHAALKAQSNYLDSFTSFENLEYFPVRRVFDFTGKEYNIAFAKKSIII